MSNPSQVGSLIQLSIDAFIDQFKPVRNHLDANASFNGCMFETYKEELAHVVATHETKPLHVWTILDVDGEQVVTNGMMRVDRIGYLITEIPAEPNRTYEATDEEDQ